jgi:Ca2+-binding EF-hand superfamily protein
MSRSNALRGLQEELERMTTLGRSPDERRVNLENYALRLRDGKKEMRANHFVSLVKGLRLRRDGAEDAFAVIDAGNKGTLPVEVVVAALLNQAAGGYPSSQPPGPKQAAQSASSPKGPSRSGGNKLNSSFQLHTKEKPHEVDLSSQIVESFRKTVVQRGGSHGIHALGRIFKIIDDDGNHKLSATELKTGLADYGLKYDDNAIRMLMACIDKKNTGVITFDDFLITLRGPVSKRRRALIDMAFKVLDKSGNGIVTVDDIASNFNTKSHPDVQSGRMKPDQALQNWLAQFDGPDGDGKITKDEFQHYYKNVSASIDDDDYFELMIRNAWHIPGGQGQYENTANTRVLATFVDGTQKVVMIEDDLGLDLNDQQAVLHKLKKQGIKNVVSVSRSGKT